MILHKQEGGDNLAAAAFQQRMTDELNDRITKLADEYGVSKNTMINIACEEFLITGKLQDLKRRVNELEKEVQTIKNQHRSDL